MVVRCKLWGKQKLGIDVIIELIETLRGKDGCPWDKKQTPRTIAAYLLEEIYELIEAIESGSSEHVCEELGDVLFHILFIASLFREMGHFDIKAVVDVNAKKMTRRHPHVFGNGSVDGAEAVGVQWHKIKMEEKNHTPEASILDSVPTGLPALMRAFRISERAAKAGFDWNDVSDVMAKVEEEWAELKYALKEQDRTNLGQGSMACELEFGDVLFTLVNVARFAHIHPESALRGSTRKFEKRFKHMEGQILKDRRTLESVSQAELDVLWEKAKDKIG